MWAVVLKLKRPRRSNLRHISLSLIFVVVLVGVLSCESTQREPDRKPAGTYWSHGVNPNIQNYPLFWPELLDPKPEWTTADLMTTIRDNKVTSVDQLIPLLPASFLQNYGLVYASRSIQKSNPNNPRVIMYGRDAQLVMTFSGDKNLEGFNALEVMEFNKYKREFSLYEIVLDGKNVPLQLPQKNPAKCLSCHHRDPRPIWSSYPKWPGVYQSFEETVLGNIWRDRVALRHGADNSEERELIEKEVGLYANYLRLKDSHPRYKHLVTHSDERVSRVIKFFADHYSSNEAYKESLRQINFATPRPNLDIGFFLSEMNMMRVMRKIEKHPKARAFGYALLASTMCFGEREYYAAKFPIDKFFPPDFKFKKSLEDSARETGNLSRLNVYYDREIERKMLGGEERKPDLLEPSARPYIGPAENLQFVLDNMNMDTTDLSLEFHNSFNYVDGVGEWRRFQRYLWRFALYPKEMHPDIYGDFSDRFSALSYQIVSEERLVPVCKRLMELSSVAIARGYR